MKKLLLYRNDGDGWYRMSAYWPKVLLADHIGPQKLGDVVEDGRLTVLLRELSFFGFCPTEFTKITGVELGELEVMEVEFTETGMKWGQVWKYYLEPCE